MIRVAAALLLPLALSPPTPAQTDAPEAPVAVATTRPSLLVGPAGERLGPGLGRTEIPVREAGPGERRTAARRWLGEIFAPLSEPDCRTVLAAALLPVEADPPGAEGFPDERPTLSGPAGEEILVPAELDPLGPSAVERFRATGILRFEISAAGEYARAQAARHAGPVPRDPLLRLARATRLEGVARLAGLTLVSNAAGVPPDTLGLSLLLADRDEAGVPRAFLEPAARDVVRRALVDSFLDDGVRWALFHYLRGGFAAVAGALERPGLGPETLIRPGAVRPAPPSGPAGCALGPRAAAALLTGDDDPAWIGNLLADRWKLAPSGTIAVWLAFDDAASAAAAASDLGRRGIEMRQEQTVLLGGLKPAPREKPTPP